MTDKKSLIGILCALLANVIFGFCFIFSKTALKYADPLIISSIRFTIAFLVFNLLLLTKKFKLSFKGKPKLNLIIMGLAQPFLYFIFELYGLSLISSATSISSYSSSTEKSKGLSKCLMETSYLLSFVICYNRPVEPKPPRPRSVSLRLSLSSKSTLRYGVKIICAMRSATSMVTASSEWL